MIKLIPPKAYGGIKPLANHLGQPIQITPPPRPKKRRRRRAGPQETYCTRSTYHV
jgi:hypothetical protein